jgi:transposase
MKMKPAEVIVSPEHLVIRKKRDGRCVYSREGKRALVAACLRPGVSVAGIALVHGVNANVLRKWITHHHQWQDKTDSVHTSHAIDSSNPSSPVSVTPPALQSSPSNIPALVPVQITPDTDRPSAPPTAAVSAANTGSPMVIELYGARILIEGEVNRGTLMRILDCLRAVATTS